MSETIHWYAWNNEARKRAFEQQQLIMVFCGQELDHWSQRWLREIESHAELCESINQVCVPVKMRVEEDIELAARAQEVLAVTSNSQGFPVIIWLTPNGNPIGATPYRPILDGEQMRGLAPMFIEIIEAWHEHHSAVEADVEQMREAWRMSAGLIDAQSDINIDRLADACEAHIMSQADSLEGGFGSAPRALPYYLLAFLLKRMRSEQAAPSLKEHVIKTINALIAGGVHDHLHGGFFRAATDASWNIPFFEKRAIDQIQMVSMLLEAAALCEQDVYTTIAEETLAFIESHLHADNDVCAWGLSAESIGVNKQLINGAAYLWSYQGIEEVIGKDGAAIINKRFLSDQRCFIDDDFAVLAIRDELNVGEREQLPQLCQRLAHARLERPQAARDETCVLYVQAALLRLYAQLKIQNKLSVNQEWAAQLQLRLLDAHYHNVRDRAAAALAVYEWDVANDTNKHAAWVHEQAEIIRQQYKKHEVLLLEDDPVFADAVIAGPDNDDYQSPVSVVYQLWSHVDDFSDDAEALLRAYTPLIRAAPLAHSSLLTAYFHCLKV